MRKFILFVATAAGLTAAAACEPVEDAPPVQGADARGGKTGAPTRKTKPPIGLAAKRTIAEHSILSEGGALTCVKVTVANNSKKKVEINPLYFAITGKDNVKHDAGDALGEYEGQVATTDIAPGEKVKGVVCVKGKFAPKTVSMTNPLFSTAARAAVAS
ncbi:DUF4352 domain-containing protein [Actinomadura citrea]|uniref:DUF4352 domain-containing protein n=1 Tax=Actinomadura citrea TaxID=46158 RepID=UPI003CE5AAE1